MSQHVGQPYQKALEFWFSSINYEQRAPNPDDLKLDPMRALLDRLGNPHRRLRVLHVAGSKGKGSTSALLAAILQEAGYRTGLFTSPHLCRIEERMQVDGQTITAPELTALLEEVRQVVNIRAITTEAKASLSPTFFEIATAVGFLHFVRRRVDVAVVEVGLGGRFDATNVCLPEVALITSISFDHTRLLGNRLESIAMEKAGIVKPGRPAISGTRAPEARAVIERICRERQAQLLQLDQDFHYVYEPGTVTVDGTATPLVRPPQVRIITRQRSWPVMQLGLLGEHQAANAAVAVACIEQLCRTGWHVPDAAVAAGLAGVRWPARMEVMGQRPLAVLDCAHNVASAEALVATLRSSFPPSRRLLVFASSNDKDVAGIFRILGPHFAHAFLTRYSNNQRSVPPEELAQLLARSGGPPSTVCADANSAWRLAEEMARPEDLVCVTGSVFLAGELRPVLEERISIRSDERQRRD